MRQPVAKEALGIDRVGTEPLAQALAKFADVAFDHILVDAIVEQAINEIENLRFGDPAAFVRHQIFEDSPFAPWQGQRLAVDLGVAPVGEDPDTAGQRRLHIELHAPADRFDSREDLAHVHRLADDIVDARREELERIAQGLGVVHRNDGCARTGPDLDRNFPPVLKIPKQEGFYGIDIRLGRSVDPLPEIGRREPGRGHAFAAKPGGVAVQDSFAFIDYDDHGFPESQRKSSIKINPRTRRLQPLIALFAWTT